jgi:sulfonate transport system substrate-binding protein
MLKALLRTAIFIAALALPVAATAATKLKVAYIPIMPMSQLYVMEAEGWTKEAGLDLELTKFSSGPAIVQAIASGDFDVMYFGIGPALVSRAKGVPIKVVASNVIEQIALITRGDFAKAMKAAASPAEGVRAFTKAQGRKPKIASLPKGSVPDLVLRYWLIRVAGLKESDIDIVGMGTGKVQQAMLAQSVDGASILEPVVTIIQERLKDAYIPAQGGQMFPKQPGAVVAVRESVIKEKRDAIQKLVDLHVRATKLIKEDPKRAAKAIHAFLGQGLVPVATFEKALASPTSNFVADPAEIVAATKVMHDFSAEIGTLKKPVPLDVLFDLSFYRADAGK